VIAAKRVAFSMRHSYLAHPEAVDISVTDCLTDCLYKLSVVLGFDSVRPIVWSMPIIDVATLSHYLTTSVILFK